MARIRSVKPEFWDDRKLARSTSRDARLLYIGLWNQADEHGRCNGDPTWIKGRVFPYESDIGADECARHLDELARGGWVQKYSVDGDPFLFLPNLAAHQRLEPDKVPSRLPAPPGPEPCPPSDQQVCTSPRAAQIGADESARDADQSSLLYVAGSREHVAGMPGADECAPEPDPAPSFADFWDVYPRHEGKRAAVAAFERAVKRADPQMIINGAKRYREDRNRVGQFTKHPATWLNQDCWTDDPLPARDASQPAAPVNSVWNRRVT
jgi:hypothetical protein